MDGRVKSRGRRSLVKRHRGSRLSVPLPAVRIRSVVLPRCARQRVEPMDARVRWAACSFARPAAWCLANARRRACAVNLERREHSRARPAVTAIWTLSEALFLATADQASGRCRRWKNRLAAMDRESDRTGRRETPIVPHTDLGGHLRRSTAAVGRATCPTTARLPAAARTSRPTRPCI